MKGFGAATPTALVSVQGQINIALIEQAAAPRGGGSGQAPPDELTAASPEIVRTRPLRGVGQSSIVKGSGASGIGRSSTREVEP